MSDSHRLPAAFALVAAIVDLPLAPVFIRALTVAYDPHTQNLLRYGSAAVPLVAISVIAFPRELRIAFRDYRSMVGISLVNLVLQYTWTVGCAGSTATTSQLISKLSIVFVIVFSFLFFHEERAVIRSSRYLVGTFLGLVGVAALISRDPGSIVPVLDKPTVMLLITAVLWAIYTVWAKHLVMRIHPIPMFTVVSVYITIGFAVSAVLFGTPASLVTASRYYAVLGVVSGLVAIAAAHPAFHFAQKHLGSALCSSVALFNPLITYLVALCIWPDESLILTQWLGAAVLLLGTLLVTFTGQRVPAMPTQPPRRAATRHLLKGQDAPPSATDE